MPYAYASLPRAGLANKLFPWARCQLYARRNQLQSLSSSWTHLAIGPWLRGERDKRTYFREFENNEGLFAEIRKQFILSSYTKYCEQSDGTFSPLALVQEKSVLVFRGVDPYFRTLLGCETELKADLLRITHTSILAAINNQQARAPIGIHVRRGDFSKPKSKEDFKIKGGLRTPLLWFEQSLEWIRKKTGHSLHAFVFSDGDSNELASLLTLPNVTRVSTGTAVGDLLCLARSPLIIGSGGSSFSAWAAFLGKSSLITIPGQSPAWFGLSSHSGRYVGEFSPDCPPETFQVNVCDGSVNF